jgi:hypothetical protein
LLRGSLISAGWNATADVSVLRRQELDIDAEPLCGSRHRGHGSNHPIDLLHQLIVVRRIAASRTSSELGGQFTRYETRTKTRYEQAILADLRWRRLGL